MQKLKTTALACVISLLPILGHASVITFDDALSWNGTQSSHVKNFSSGGFNFNLLGTGATLTDTQACTPLCPVNGTNIALVPYGPSSLFMAKSDHGTFSLIGFQGTGSFNFNSTRWGTDNMPDNIDVIGQLSGGGTVTQSFQIDKASIINGALSFSNYAFNDSFTNLLSASFSSRGSADALYNGFAIDNIAVASVPEPETYTLLLAGLAAIGGIALRRKPY